MRPRTGLLVRLAWRNLRHRPGQALLLLLALGAATTTLSLALAVGDSGDAPWDRVWRATNGFHVGAVAASPNATPLSPRQLARARRDLAGLTGAPGVVASSGPWDTLDSSGVVGGVSLDLVVEVRGQGPAAVGQPLLTAGRWLGGDQGVVLEDGLATTMQVRPGDGVTIAGRRLPVRGVAMTVSRNRFPLSQPGLVWANPATGRALRAAGAATFASGVELRLADPDQAAAFVDAHQAAGGGDAPVVTLGTWREQRASSHSDVTVLGQALLGVGLLLAALTVATAAVLVGGRMAAQVRQVGTLKAVGVTPWQVTAVLLLENLGLAVAAAAAGLGVGTRLSPLLARSSTTLFGAPAAPPLSLARCAVVGGVAVAVVALATVRPALRGARRSTLRSLTPAVRPPRRAGRLARLGGLLGLQLPGVLGLRSTLRRPGRTLVNTAGLTLGVAMVVVAACLQRSLRLLHLAPPGRGGDLAARLAVEASYRQVRAVVVAAAALVLLLAAVNLLIVAAFAARDGARNHAVMRALGATPRQTVTALVVSQLGACVVACLVGIPLGLILFGLADGGDLPPVRLPLPQLALVAAAVPVLFALLLSIPARRFARRPVTPLLTYE